MAESAVRHDRTAEECEIHLIEFLRAPSPEEKESVLARNPWLLSESAEAALSRRAAAETDPAVRQDIQTHLELFVHLRSALADAGPASETGGSSPPAELQGILQELRRPASIPEMPRRVLLCERALRLIDRPAAPELWAILQGELGNALLYSPQGSRSENVERAIGCYERALEVMTREALPVEWATTQMNLGNGFLARILGDRAENVEHAIGCYQRALEVTTREAMPREWAATQNNLGAAHHDRIRGQRAENVESAIGCYERALEVRTREATPREWATTQNNLGSAYHDRIRGQRAENMEFAIGCYERALEVRTREALPADWAQTQNNLGNAYRDNVQGHRGENVERAIGCYERALEVRTREAAPLDWAQTQNNLGTAYINRIRGDRAENIESAIDCHQRALGVMTREALPLDWAQLQMNLGTAYNNRIRGDRAENAERSIACYERTLDVVTREALPMQWAITRMNLGIACKSRICGERAENIDRSIDEFHSALEVITREASPADWANVQNNLGNAYQTRIRGDRRKNLECAIACYERALEVRTQQGLPLEWADVQMNLGNAYLTRIEGERSENLERAITCYERALVVSTRETRPLDWARTQMNLGNAYNHRIRGERGENNEQAIRCYESALEVRTRDALPFEWATAQMNLGNTYRERLRGEVAENLEMAIACYERALEVRTQKLAPFEWAQAQMNMGNAYLDRVRGAREENVETAIACYDRAQEVVTRESQPWEWANLNIGLAYAYLCRFQGERANNLERAIGYYERALVVMTREALPADHLDVQQNLQTLMFREERWEPAAAAGTSILAAHELLYVTAPTPEARHRLLREIRGVSARLSYARAKLGGAYLPEAVLALENGRAQFLAEALQLDEAPLHEARPEDRYAFETARAELNRLQALARLPEGQPGRPTFLQLSERLSTAYSGLNSITSTIRAYMPDWMPKTSYRDIQAAAQASPIAYLTVTESGGLALIVRRDGAVDPVWLPDLTEDALVQELRRHFTAYAASRNEWHDALDATLRWCWRAVMEPLISSLAGEEEAVLIPGGLLGLLPLHAAYTVDGTTRRYAMDAVRLRYAPSARALHSAARSAAHIAPDALLAIDQPQPVHGNPLPNSAREVDAALSHFPNAGLRLPSAQATLDAVRARVAEYPVLHFSCHGFTNFKKPLEGGLVLAHDNVLTLRHFLDARLPRARLAILSACETGIPGTELPDEVISLPAALMQAGVDGVIGSLWSVADISTMMLMARFYEYWKGEGNAPPQALRAAQQWVRDTSLDEKREFFKSRLPEFAGANRMPHETADWLFKAIALTDIDFSHPFHWAAFSYLGV